MNDIYRVEKQNNIPKETLKQGVNDFWKDYEAGVYSKHEIITLVTIIAGFRFSVITA